MSLENQSEVIPQSTNLELDSRVTAMRTAKSRELAQSFSVSPSNCLTLMAQTENIWK